VISATRDTEYYFVVVLAGQSNAMAYGEGLPLPDSYDAPDPRIKQLARRSTVTPGGAACRYNDIIPADHCLHDVQDMSTLNLHIMQTMVRRNDVVIFACCTARCHRT
ncbi:hypothetical protein MMS39_29335, partial [Escherichia coli]|nr:hypothetical protein [Escherichia coli]